MIILQTYSQLLGPHRGGHFCHYWMPHSCLAWQTCQRTQVCLTERMLVSVWLIHPWCCINRPIQDVKTHFFFYVLHTDRKNFSFQNWLDFFFSLSLLSEQKGWLLEWMPPCHPPLLLESTQVKPAGRPCCSRCAETQLPHQRPLKTVITLWASSKSLTLLYIRITWEIPRIPHCDRFDLYPGHLVFISTTESW